MASRSGVPLREFDEIFLSLIVEFFCIMLTDCCCLSLAAEGAMKFALQATTADGGTSGERCGLRRGGAVGRR